ncbi:MAG: ankyrin repeat domain-containing protein [Shewanella sp.]|nr:ankyrin repeat domain-containing protein [Shewanella sp.]
MSGEYTTLSLSHSGQSLWNQEKQFSLTSPQEVKTSVDAYFLISAQQSQHSQLSSPSTDQLSDFHKLRPKTRRALSEIPERDTVRAVNPTPKRTLTPYLINLLNPQSFSASTAKTFPIQPTELSRESEKYSQAKSLRDRRLLLKISKDIETLTTYISDFPNDPIKPILLYRINNFLQEHPQSLKTEHITSAFELGHTELIEVLLENLSCPPIFLATGGFISTKDQLNHSDNSPLCIAIKTGNHKMIKAFLKCKVALNFTYENNQNIFHFAAKNGNYSVFKLIIDAWSAQADSQNLQKKLQEKDTLLGDTPAHMLMQFGDIKCVDFLLCKASLSVLGSENIAQNTPIAICGKRPDFNDAWFLYSFHRNKECSHLKSSNTHLFERNKKLEEQIALQQSELTNVNTTNQKLHDRVKQQNLESIQLQDDQFTMQRLNEALQVENLSLRCQLSSKEKQLKLPEINQSGSLMHTPTV